MTPPKSPPQQAVSVEQADRDAAADYIRHHDYPRSEDIRKGRCDNHAAVVAFARHRLSAAMPADGVLREAWTCAALKYQGQEPQDCNWPYCGCDPKATEVLQALDEHGYDLVDRHAPKVDADRLMQDFYLSPAYNPKAARPAETVRDAIAWALSAAPKAPTAPIGEVSAPGADGLKSIGHDLAMAAGNLVVATDGQEAIRAERIAVLNALKAWEKTLADRAQGEGEKAS